MDLSLQDKQPWDKVYPTTGAGVKYDQEKVPLQLLDPLALEGVANVLAFGARKYAAENWRGGISYKRLLGAILRHTFAIMRGEDIDSESGLPHVDHLGCTVMFLSNMMKTRKDLDDRWKENPPVAGAYNPENQFMGYAQQRSQGELCGGINLK